MIKTSFLFPLLLVSGLLGSCHQSHPPNSTDANEVAPPPSDASSADESQSVEYEPAYPAEVSSEGLTDEDIAQQPSATHSHDGEGEHSHDGANGQTHSDDHQHD